MRNQFQSVCVRRDDTSEFQPYCVGRILTSFYMNDEIFDMLMRFPPVFHHTKQLLASHNTIYFRVTKFLSNIWWGVQTYNFDRMSVILFIWYGNQMNKNSKLNFIKNSTTISPRMLISGIDDKSDDIALILMQNNQLFYKLSVCDAFTCSKSAYCKMYCRNEQLINFWVRTNSIHKQ